MRSDADAAAELRRAEITKQMEALARSIEEVGRIPRVHSNVLLIAVADFSAPFEVPR